MVAKPRLKMVKRLTHAKEAEPVVTTNHAVVEGPVGQTVLVHHIAVHYRSEERCNAMMSGGCRTTWLVVATVVLTVTLPGPR